MTILLDTSVLIDCLRGDSAARQALAQAVEGGERLVSSVADERHCPSGASNRRGENVHMHTEKTRRTSHGSTSYTNYRRRTFGQPGVS